jgi:hypothetical protein
MPTIIESIISSWELKLCRPLSLLRLHSMLLSDFNGKKSILNTTYLYKTNEKYKKRRNQSKYSSKLSPLISKSVLSNSNMTVNNYSPIGGQNSLKNAFPDT